MLCGGMLTYLYIITFDCIPVCIYSVQCMLFHVHQSRFCSSRTVICIKRSSNVGYEIGLEDRHDYHMDKLNTDSLVVSNEEQAKTIVGALHSISSKPKLSRFPLSALPVKSVFVLFSDSSCVFYALLV